VAEHLPTDLVVAARQFETGDAATIQILGALADEIERLESTNAVVLESHGWLYQEKKRLEDVVGRLRGYIIDHGDKGTMAPAVEIADRALAFAPITDDVGGRDGS
jgi:hypothetical protein